jgi:hypothetical protein
VATNDPATAHFTAIKTWETQEMHTNQGLCVASELEFCCLFRHASVWNLLDTPSYTSSWCGTYLSTDSNLPLHVYVIQEAGPWIYSVAMMRRKFQHRSLHK